MPCFIRGLGQKESIRMEEEPKGQDRGDRIPEGQGSMKKTPEKGALRAFLSGLESGGI